MINCNAPTDHPLILVDGKETTDIKHLQPDDIASFSILKDDKALELYGEKGRDGVILVTTRNGKVDASEKTRFIIKKDVGEGASEKTRFIIKKDKGEGASEQATVDIKGIIDECTSDDKKPLVLIDGQEAKIENIKPDDIKEVSILKDKTAIELYGEKAKDGVIIITSKSAAGEDTTSEQDSGVDTSSLVDILAGKLTDGEETASKQDTGAIKSILRKRIAEGSKPLVLIDGKEIESIEDIKSADIYFTTVNEGGSTKQYGEKAKDGVIHITSKKVAREYYTKADTLNYERLGLPFIDMLGYVTSGSFERGSKIKNPVLLVDRREVKTMKDVKREDIHSFSISYGRTSATELYGEGKDGIISVITKKYAVETGDTVRVRPHDVKPTDKERAMARKMVKKILASENPSAKYILNGYQVYFDNLKRSISLDKVESVRITKDDIDAENTGESGQNETISITTKKDV
jgi:TonB-dependent SusC/RagA subfamily outer membrane receptor